MAKKGRQKKSPPASSDLVPVLALRDVVVFPGMILPLFVGRDKSMAALDAAMDRERLILLATQLDARVENPTKDDLYPVGTVAEILQLLKLPDGTVKVLVEGKCRAEILALKEGAFFEATSQFWEEQSQLTKTMEALRRTVLAHFEQYVKLNQSLSVEVINSAQQIEDIGRLGDLIASHMLLKVEQKQDLLGIKDPALRLEEISKLLNNEIEILSLEKKIFSRVRKQMEKNQKEYFLKEQLRAIHQELGQEDARSLELQELRKRLETGTYPEDVKKVLEKQIGRLESLHQDTAETGVVRSYVDWLLDLPWEIRVKDHLELKAVQKCLNQDHYGLEEVKERILEHLAVSKLTGSMQGAILCLVGPPGVGKTSLGRSIARAIGRPYVRVSLGGVRDEAEIRGHRRTYVGALPGRIVQSMKKAEARNPVMLLDEVDKMSMDFRGDPSAALLEVLDPEQNKEFSDHYLELPFDLSDVFFITTANLLDPIPGPLRDRMEIVRIPGYTEEEKKHILQKHLLPKQLTRHGLNHINLELSDDIVLSIIRSYTRESGVRELERTLARLLRKVAVQVVKKPSYIPDITTKELHKYLGVPKFDHGVALPSPRSGVATGLAYTSVGGDVLFIETLVVPGKGKLQLTGSLGDVMKESAQAAMSLIKSRAGSLSIPVDFFEKHDLHVHVPEGAMPKDGPSAGVTMFSSMLSAITQKPLRNDLAMTGEITLRGDVLAVGGLKEKTMAAARLGISEVILPADNKKNHEELPPTVRKQLKFHYVGSVDALLPLILVGDREPVSKPKKSPSIGQKGKNFHTKVAQPKGQR